MPQIWKTTISVTVLSEGPYELDSLEGVHYDITFNDCMGDFEATAARPLTNEEAEEAVTAMGGDPEFFAVLAEHYDIPVED